MKQYTLIGADNVAYATTVPGTLGGHRTDRIYGTLGCPGAARAIARGGYVANRVFFADEPTAIAAGYRPCATCLPDAYRTWKEHRAMPLTHTTVASPIGELVLLADGDALCEIRFDVADIPPDSPRVDSGVLGEAARQLRGYADGVRTAFDLPLRPRFGGAFERRVWATSPRSPTARPRPTARSRPRSTHPAPPARSAPPTAATRCRWSSRAIASSARAAR